MNNYSRILASSTTLLKPPLGMKTYLAIFLNKIMCFILIPDR